MKKFFGRDKGGGRPPKASAGARDIASTGSVPSPMAEVRVAASEGGDENALYNELSS